MCIQLACSLKPRAFEEAHYWNIQANFYNEKFPLVYESDNIWDSLYEKHGATLKHKIWDSLHEEHDATLKHKCGKRDSNIAPFIYFLFFLSFFLFFGPLFFFFLAFLFLFLFFWTFFFLLAFFGPFFILAFFGQCSNNDDHHTSIDYNIWITTRN